MLASCITHQNRPSFRGRLEQQLPLLQLAKVGADKFHGTLGCFLAQVLDHIGHLKKPRNYEMTTTKIATTTGSCDSMVEVTKKTEARVDLHRAAHSK